jgi:tetratricopeptide (TPR) repeat protein
MEEVLKTTDNEHQRWQTKSRIVKLLQKQNRTDEAIEMLRDQIKSAPHESYAGQARQAYVTLLRKSNKLDEYLKGLEQIVVDKPNDTKAIEELAELYRSSGKSAEGATWYEKLVALRPDKNAYVGWVSSLSSINEKSATLRDKRLDALLSAYNAFFKAFPDERKARLSTLIRSCRNAGREKEAIDFSAQNVSLQPGNASAHSLYGETLRHFKKYEESIAAYRKAIEFSPAGNTGRWNFKLHIGYSLEAQKKLKEAEAIAHSLMAEATQSYQRQNVSRFLVRVLRGSFIYASRNVNKTKAAEPIVRRFVKDNPNEFQQLGTLADSLSREGHYKDAIATYKEVISRKVSEHERAYWRQNLARSYKAAGQLAEALNEITRAINHSRHEGFKKNANDLKTQWLKESDGAKVYVKSLEDRLKNNPQDASALSELIKGYRAQKEIEKVAALCADLVKLEPTRQAYLQWIDALIQLKEHEQVIAAYQALFEKLPASRADLLNRLMWAHQQAGQQDEAVAAGEEHEKLNPQHGFSAAQFGYLLLSQKKYDKAIDAYQRAVKLAPSKFHKWDWQFRIAKIHRQSVKEQEAVSLLKQLAESAPSPLYEKRAQALLKGGSQP